MQGTSQKDNNIAQNPENLHFSGSTSKNSQEIWKNFQKHLDLAQKYVL